MLENDSEDSERTGKLSKTRMHAATRAKLADALRFIGEGQPLAQALASAGMSRSSFYRLRDEAGSLSTGSGPVKPDPRFRALKAQYGHQIAQLAMHQPYVGANAYAGALHLLGAPVSARDVKRYLEEKSLASPECRMMAALLFLHESSPQIPEILSRLVDTANTMPLLIADTIPSRRLVVIEAWNVPKAIAGRRGMRLLFQYNPMTFEIRTRVVDDIVGDALIARHFEEMLPENVTIDEIPLLRPVRAVVGHSILGDDKDTPRRLGRLQECGYPLRCLAPAHSLVTRAASELSKLIGRWILQELHRLQRQHPAPRVEDSLARITNLWNHTKRIPRGDSHLDPRGIYAARLTSTRMAWSKRHRHEGGVNAAAQLDILLTIGEKMLVHVKPEAWTAKCVEMINECGNNPACQLFHNMNLGKLVVAAAALVHPDCRTMLPVSAGGTCAYKTEVEYAGSLLSAARNQGHLSDFYEKNPWEWFRSVFTIKDYHKQFPLLPQPPEPEPGSSENPKSPK